MSIASELETKLIDFYIIEEEIFKRIRQELSNEKNHSILIQLMLQS